MSALNKNSKFRVYCVVKILKVSMSMFTQLPLECSALLSERKVKQQIVNLVNQFCNKVRNTSCRYFIACLSQMSDQSNYSNRQEIK